ncbi:MAG: 30S ribosomal protein S2 [Sedimentisphaerales bacterium]|nr:30S ribosomal protein S2 [Sedimentisphaerales bacterium]
MRKELARELIGAGVHFGHGASRWNPKMEPYIFGKRGMIHIINVKETLRGILIAKKLLINVVSSGKDVVFVGTKRQAQKGVRTVAEQSGMHFVSERWLGGMLTNFRTVRSRLQRLEELEKMEASGSLASESKKQESRLKREMRKIETNLGGVRKMNRLPGAVVVVDAKKELTALREAAKLGIATIGIIDTDSNPDDVDVAIPANDDSIKAVELILRELGEAIAAGKAAYKPITASTTVQPAGKRRSRRRSLASAAEETTAENAAPAEKQTEPAADKKDLKTAPENEKPEEKEQASA